MKNNYSVYVHTNKTNGKRYVGITRQDPPRRWQKGAGYAGTYFGNAIRKYGWDGFAHDVLATGLTKESACEMEIRLIAEYKTADKKHGYNISKGGDTCDVITGRRGLDNPRHQRVKMIDKDTGEVLQIYPSQTAAAEDLGISRKGITKACVGTNATYMGYRWEYADKDYIRPINPGAGNYDHVKQQKTIRVTEPDGTEKIYPSVNDAAADLGINRSNISRYAIGLRKDASGRRWCYV